MEYTTPMSETNTLPALTFYRARLKAIYWFFFRNMGIDCQTGDLPARFPNHRKYKFACYPYVGSRYGTDPNTKKVLVVGLDIGCDENPGEGIKSLEERSGIECAPVDKLNPHIAGTYFTALRYACPQRGWERFQDAEDACQTILKKRGAELPSINPLSFIALTNFYKWVKKGSQSRKSERKYFDCKVESQLFLNEVRCLEPDVVVFQSTSYGENKFKAIRESIKCQARECHVLVHPSYPRKLSPWMVTQPGFRPRRANDSD